MLSFLRIFNMPKNFIIFKKIRTFGHDSERILEPVSKLFQSSDEKLRMHRAINHELFIYLNTHTNIGLSQNQYRIYRDNFFFRTFNTIPSIARVVIAAAKEADYKTLSGIGKNLYEETGEGHAENCHLKLLEESHNLHGKKIFNLDEISLKESNGSPYILSHTKEFIKKQDELYLNNSYFIVLGASYAHETAAESMLEKFRNFIMDPYSGYYEPSEYEVLNKYFDAHLRGVEHEHGENAKKAILRICKTKENVDHIFEAANKFLDAQANLWDGMLLRIKEFEHEPKIPPSRKSKKIETQTEESNFLSMLYKMLHALYKKAMDPNDQDTRVKLQLIAAILGLIIMIIGYVSRQYLEKKENERKKMSELNEIINEDGNLDKIEVLLNGISDINSKDDNGLSPIYFAVIKRNVALVNKFIEQNANVDVRRKDGKNLTHIVCQNNQIPNQLSIETELIKIIVSKSSSGSEILLQTDNDGVNAFFDAAANGKIDILKFLHKNYPVEFKKGINKSAKNKWTPLTTSMKHLLDQSDNLEVRKNHAEVIDFILETDDEIYCINEIADQKFTALSMAVDLDDINLVKKLLKKNANPNSQNAETYPFTPLHIAVKKGNVDIIRELLDKNANPNIQKESLLTPLHIAAYQGKFNIVKILVEEYNADPLITNDLNKTAAIRARESGQYAIAEYLEKKELHNNGKKNHGFFPFFKKKEDSYTKNDRTNGIHLEKTKPPGVS